MNTLKRTIAGLALVTAAYAPQAMAQLTLDLDHRFQGGTVTALPASYVTATFTDVVGGVLLDVFNTASAPGSLNSIYLNVNSYSTPLTFTWQSGVTLASSNGVRQGLDSRKADGDGYYDLELNYPGTSFGPDSHSVYQITGGGVTASSFKSLSVPSGGYFPFYAAAHTGGVWVAAIPEPETYVMMIAGLALMGWIARRRKHAMELERV